MSKTSPFRTDDDKAYRWPPDPQPVEKTYDRVTSCLDGVPKPWLGPWTAKVISEYVATPGNWLRLGQYFDPAIATTSEAEMELQIQELREEGIRFLKKLTYGNMNRAASVGTDVHSICEELSYGRNPAIPPALAKHADAYKKFLNDWQPEFQFIEGTIFSDEHGYAGTFDWIAKIRGMTILGDNKTSKGGIKDITAMQMAAYRYSDFVGDPAGKSIPLPQIDECMALSITERGYELIPLQADEEIFEMFLAAKKMKQWADETSKDVLGEPLVP